MGFELRKGILNGNQILSVVVLFQELFVEAMKNSALEDVGIVVSRHFASCRVETSGMLSEQLDVFLRDTACSLDGFGALACTICDFFRFVLDLGVQPFEDRQDRSSEVLGGFSV